MSDEFTGTMPCVCMYCGRTYATKPCVPAMNGKASHGVCEGCAPRLRSEADALFFAESGRETAKFSPGNTAAALGGKEEVAR